ncbi:hypothetical protein [Borreliella garinii]|uniref:Uncharacterized protein n=1 Tax=Borreliella garinii PBr TaxID=498743 RepID=B8F0I7_BORGR|nr:hypothetical protein [Borreliella garinii]ACL34458.1 hypothetical protein BGAPBR_E0007 [Borreliella garinii PBr]ACL34616.1 hypothetical protein BGAPBR_I0005 [Borreliella garinii PBr]
MIRPKAALVGTNINLIFLCVFYRKAIHNTKELSKNLAIHINDIIKYLKKSENLNISI